MDIESAKLLGVRITVFGVIGSALESVQSFQHLLPQ